MNWVWHRTCNNNPYRKSIKIKIRIMKTLGQYLAELKEDTDVYVDGIGDGMAVCVPVQKLTDEGLRYFGDCLSLSMDEDSPDLVVGTDEDYDNLYEYEEEDKGNGGRLMLAWEFLCAMAGYCSTSKYDKWFYED